MHTPNMTMELSRELIYLNRTNEQQEMIIEELRLKAAMYKAHFFGKRELSNKLSKQISENLDARVGIFDGFCYAGWRANAIYRTLEDMLRDGLITREEYDFCDSV